MTYLGYVLAAATFLLSMTLIGAAVAVWSTWSVYFAALAAINLALAAVNYTIARGSA